MASKRVMLCLAPVAIDAVARPIAVVDIDHHADLAFSGENRMRITAGGVQLF